MQNIYRSEEFFDTAPPHNMSVPHIASGQIDGRGTEALVKHAADSAASGVILPDQFDENSELADA